MIEYTDSEIDDALNEMNIHSMIEFIDSEMTDLSERDMSGEDICKYDELKIKLDNLQQKLKTL